MCCEILVRAIQSIRSNSALVSPNANRFAGNVAYSAAEGTVCMTLLSLISETPLYYNARALQLSQDLQCLRTLRSKFSPAVQIASCRSKVSEVLKISADATNLHDEMDVHWL